MVRYDLVDLDGSIDNAVSPIALHYRVGLSGDFTNIPAAFVADATFGPSAAGLVTPVHVNLPPAVNLQPLVELRIMTSNAVGNDEWVGVDNLFVPEPSSQLLQAAGAVGVALLDRWRRRRDRRPGAPGSEK